MPTMQELRDAFGDDARILGRHVELALENSDPRAKEDILSELLDLLFPDINDSSFVSPDAFTTLLFIAQKNNVNLKQWLLTKREGKNLLMWALEYQNKAITDILLNTAKNEGFLDELLESETEWGTPLLLFALKSPAIPDPAVASWFVDRLLIAANAVDFYRLSFFKKFLLAASPGGETAVQNAQENYHDKSMVTTLLSNADDENCIPELLSPIYTALGNAIVRGNSNAVEEILTTASNMEYFAHLLNHNTATMPSPLVIAINKKNIGILRIVLDRIKLFNQNTVTSIDINKIILDARVNQSLDYIKQGSSTEQLLDDYGFHHKTIYTTLKNTHFLGIEGNINIYMADSKGNIQSYAVRATGNTPSNYLLDFHNLMDALPEGTFGTKKSLLTEAIQDNYNALFSSTPEARKQDIDNVMRKISTGKPVYCNVGFPGHSLSAWFYKGYFIFTNRGAHLDAFPPNTIPLYTTRIYRMGNNHETIRAFLEKSYHNRTRPAEVFLQDLQTMISPWELAGGAFHKPQLIGNCNTASYKSGIEGLLLVDNNGLFLSDDPNKDHDRWLHSVSHTTYKRITTQLRAEKVGGLSERHSLFLFSATQYTARTIPAAPISLSQCHLGTKRVCAQTWLEKETRFAHKKTS